jgi:phosphoribosylglycinamide formyltransferase 1
MTLNEPLATSSPRPLARLVVLISGNGSNLQAIIDRCRTQWLPAEIVLVVSNDPNAFGLTRAKEAGIPTVARSHKDFPNREAFDQMLIENIQAYRPDWVVLAGFMRILTPNFIQAFEQRLINIHPSLLPKYQGLHTHQRALEAGDSQHGCTVHFVTPVLDEGPMVGQASIDVSPTDTIDTLKTKVHQLEYLLYPLCIKFLLESQPILLNNQPTPCLNDFIDRCFQVKNRPWKIDRKNILLSQDILTEIYAQ